MYFFLPDILAYYAFFIKFSMLVIAGFVFISGIDDLFVDLLFWGRTGYRFLFVRRKYAPLAVERLYLRPEMPFAVIVPAWQEAPVIRQMVENTLATYDYRDYHIFIGVYQNDPDTHHEVQQACRAHSNVHEVTVPNDGPTCKADCLNWIIQGIALYEQQHGFEFAGIVMHDAEDVVHRLELRLFNYLVDRKDMMQLPVLSLERPWYEFVAGHYIDEFAESHSKDMVVREMLTGSVPSAGVATCFSRRAIRALAAQNNNFVFNTDSLTEDYDISFRLKELGMKEIFLRYGLEATVRATSPFTQKVHTVRRREYVATREYFPNSFRTSARQKARWILGIVFQGWRFIGWRGNLAMRYMLMRDRKSIFAALITFLAYGLLLNVILLYGIPRVFPHAYILPPLVQPYSLPWWLLWVNTAFLLNRIFHRMLFTGLLYGWEQALLSVPRMVVGNIVAFMATARATRLFLLHLTTGKAIVWDKTDHAYPSAEQLQHMRQRLGELLIERHLITELVLTEALERQKKKKRPLGELLLEMQVVELSALASALAQHEGITVEEALQSLQSSQERTHV